jgi:hypothetical protein
MKRLRSIELCSCGLGVDIGDSVELPVQEAGIAGWRQDSEQLKAYEIALSLIGALDG